MEDVIIIGGPNGAGKTTAAQLLVPQGLEIREFVNADEIAHGLSPFNAEHAALAAGRLMLDPLADVAAIYDNADGRRILIAERLPQGSLVVHDAARWAKIERASP